VTAEAALALAESMGIDVRFASAHALAEHHHCGGGVAFSAPAFPARARVLGGEEILFRPLIVMAHSERESATTILHEIGHIHLQHHGGTKESICEIQAWAYAILTLDRPLTPDERQDATRSLRSHGVGLSATRAMFDQLKEMTA